MDTEGYRVSTYDGVHVLKSESESILAYDYEEYARYKEEREEFLRPRDWYERYESLDDLHQLVQEGKDGIVYLNEYRFSTDDIDDD